MKRLKPVQPHHKSMSAAALHKGNGSARGGAANQKQQQQHKRGIGALMLQALVVTQDDGKEWEQVHVIAHTASSIQGAAMYKPFVVITAQISGVTDATMDLQVTSEFEGRSLFACKFRLLKVSNHLAYAG